MKNEVVEMAQTMMDEKVEKALSPIKEIYEMFEELDVYNLDDERKAIVLEVSGLLDEVSGKLKDYQERFLK